MAPAESQEAEDFYDVPDAVAPLQVAERWGEGTVLLRWRKPRENDREIQSYEVRWWPWSLGGETREAEASSIQLAAEEVAEGDLCHYPLRATKPERRTPGELLHPAPLTASWVSVRAYNQEGWGDWSRATLVFFREVIGGDARNGYQEADATPGTAGSLLTWGASEDGRLGRGLEVLQRGACPELVAVPGFQECRLSSMAAGAHTCVLSQSDRLYLWGSFLPDGQDSEEVDVLVEPQEQALDFVCHAAVCGRFSTVLLSAEGRLFAWGPNEVYQCGIPGDAMVRSLTQLQVPKDEAVIQVELGEFHGVALTSSGQVLCWGQEQGPEAGLRDEPKLKGLLPESINFNEPSPRALDLPVPVTLVAAGGYHSAFLTQNGQLWSWGSNSHGQLGLGLPTEKAFVGRPRPVVLEGHTGHMAKLSLGGVHSAVLDDAGVAYTFGDNSRGQCGQGDRPHLLAPERVRELPMALGVCCGGFFSFFQVAEDLYACGWSKEGCLGFGRVSKRQLKVLRVPQPPQGRWLQLRAGASHVVALVTGENEAGFVDYGVMLEINDLQYLPDGRSFLDCVGGRRFKVLKRGMQNGYHTAKVEWIKDEPILEEELGDVKDLHQRVYNQAKSWFTNLPLIPRRRITNMFSEMPSCDTEIQNVPQGPVWIWWFLSVCPLPHEIQLEFISMSSLKSRLEKLEQLIASLQTCI